MKHLILTIILILPSILIAQPCLPEGIVFSSQTQIDSFPINYPNCTEIEGDVEIKGNDIVNLNGLITLTSLNQRLKINSNPNLINLSGLDNINIIGGSLVIGENEGLESLTGMENLNYVGNDLIIGSLNNSLSNFSGLENLDSIGGRLFISGNFALTSLYGLDNISSIGGRLEIRLNFILNDLSALQSLTSIGGDLVIHGNDSLTSLFGLENIDPSSIIELVIIENISLSICEVQSVCDYLISPNDTIVIHDNNLGCNNRQEVEDACGVDISELGNSPLISIYPNPSSHHIFIDGNFNCRDIYVTLYNQLGQKILNKKGISKKIDISYLQEVLYIIEIKSDNWVSRHKFIKE